MNRTNQPIILNCGYGRGLSVLEIATAFKKFSKNKVKINFKRRRKGERVKIVANVKKLKRNLKWNPKFYKLKQMIKSSIEWEKKLN